MDFGAVGQSPDEIQFELYLKRVADHGYRIKPNIVCACMMIINSWGISSASWLSLMLLRLWLSGESGIGDNVHATTHTVAITIGGRMYSRAKTVCSSYSSEGTHSIRFDFMGPSRWARARQSQNFHGHRASFFIPASEFHTNQSHLLIRLLFSLALAIFFSLLLLWQNKNKTEEKKATSNDNDDDHNKWIYRNAVAAYFGMVLQSQST